VYKYTRISKAFVKFKRFFDVCLGTFAHGEVCKCVSYKYDPITDQPFYNLTFTPNYILIHLVTAVNSFDTTFSESRLWRGFACSPPGKRACRSPSGECEPDPVRGCTVPSDVGERRQKGGLMQQPQNIIIYYCSLLLFMFSL